MDINEEQKIIDKVTKTFEKKGYHVLQIYFNASTNEIIAVAPVNNMDGFFIYKNMKGPTPFVPFQYPKIYDRVAQDQNLIYNKTESDFIVHGAGEQHNNRRKTMNSWEFYSRIEMFKHSQKDDELAHYGITGQKWGKRRWQNADGTFNAEGKERYFGSKSSSNSDDKMGGARSNVKDYLKFRNKMLKKHAKADMDKWYIEEHKEDDKKLLKDAKRIDKSAKKMYENQLKDYYDNPNDLVDDLN